jgi:hypothetical protein
LQSSPSNCDIAAFVFPHCRPRQNAVSAERAWIVFVGLDRGLFALCDPHIQISGLKVPFMGSRIESESLLSFLTRRDAPLSERFWILCVQKQTVPNKSAASRSVRSRFRPEGTIELRISPRIYTRCGARGCGNLCGVLIMKHTISLYIQCLIRIKTPH